MAWSQVAGGELLTWHPGDMCSDRKTCGAGEAGGAGGAGGHVVGWDSGSRLGSGASRAL